MLDSLMIRRSLPRDRFTDSYRTDQAITGSKLVNPDGKDLCVLLPPWHGGGVFYEWLIKSLARRGNAVQAYYFNGEIIKPDVEQVRASFSYLGDTIATDLTGITQGDRYTKVGMMAMSLGNLVMSMVSSRFSGFDSAHFVVGASSLATSMWHGTRTPHIRAGIEAQGYDLPAIEDAWSELAPINHISSLVGKRVGLLVSTTDEIIPTRYQEEFVRAVQDAGIDPDVNRTSLGHYASVVKFCMHEAVKTL